MKRLSTLSIITSFLLASCTQSEIAVPSGRPVTGQVPIAVDAGIAAATVSRASAGYEDIPNGGAIGIFRTAPVTTDSPAQYDVKYTYNGTQWSPANSTQQITVGGEDATLCAYYPQGSVSFDATKKTTTTLSVKDYTAADDLCYAAAPVQAVVNNANRKVSFKMVRAYSRLQFHITRHATKEYLGDCKVSSIKLEPETAGGDFFTERTIDISLPESDDRQLGGTKAGNWTLDTRALAMFTTGLKTGDENADKSIDQLFPPQAFSGGSGVKLTLTIDDIPLQVTIPNGKLSGFTAGTINVIKVEVQGVSIKLTGVEKEAWSEVDAGDYETH